MNRLTLGALATLALAAFVASRLGGALGGGVLAGATVGTGLSGLSALYQRHVLQHRPERAFPAAVLTFLIKLATLVAGAFLLRYVEPVAQRLDWRGFLVAFAGAVAFVLPLGVAEAVARAPRRPGVG
jgi:hypothetical protein